MALLIVLTAGVYLPSPLYPEYQSVFDFGDLMMTVVYAVFALVSAPALVLFGPAADALGPRLVLRASVVAAALASGCFALANGPVLLLVGRAGQGLALGAATGAATALITNHAPPGRKGRASVLAGMAFVGGTAAGPPVAGLLAQYLPAPLVVPYLVHLVLLGIGWWRVSTTIDVQQRVQRWRPTWPRIPAGIRLRFATAAATGFLAWAVAGLFLAVIPSVLDRAAGIDHLAVVGATVGAVLVCSVLIQPLVPRCGARNAQLLGLGAVLVSLVALALTGGGSLPVTMAAAGTAGIGHGLAYSGATTTIDTSAPNNTRGAVNAALYLAFYLGSGIPAVAVGLLTLGQPLTTAISGISTGTAVLIPLVGVALVLAHRRTRPRGVSCLTAHTTRTGPTGPTDPVGRGPTSEQNPTERDPTHSRV